jgi:hypothetical protein
METLTTGPARIDDDSRPRRAARWALALALAAVYLAFAFRALPRLGLNVDEATGDLLIAERYFQYLISFDPAFLELTKPVPLLDADPRHPDFWTSSPFWRERPMYTPLGGMLSALTCEVFWRRLRWLDPVDAHHAASVLLGAGLVVMLSLFSSRRFGRVAGVAAPALLLLHPRFLTDTLYDTKDVPVVFFLTATVLAYARAVTARSAGGVLGAAVLLGLGAATKPNVAFVPVIVGPWLAAVLLRARARPPRGFVLVHLAAPLVSLAAMLAVWPRMWTDTVPRLLEVARCLTQVGAGRRGGWTAEPLLEAVTTMPPAFLAAAVLGAVLPWTRRPPEPLARLLLLLWLAVPILRVSAPRMENYDGIRHFEEFLVPAALLGGAAAARLAAALARRLRAPVAAAVVLALVAVPGVWAVARTHPYGMTYFNFLVGGLPGARERAFSTPTDYWGASLREGMRRVRAAAEPGARLLVPLFDAAPVATERLHLAPEVRLVRLAELVAEPLPDDLWALVLERESHFDTTAYWLVDRARPVHTVSVEGQALLRVYRFRKGAREELESYLDGLRWVRDRMAAAPGPAAVPYGWDLHLVTATPALLGGRPLRSLDLVVNRPPDALVAVFPTLRSVASVESYLETQMELVGRGPAGARLYAYAAVAGGAERR